jgi:cysteinyl-tRNA synthetase
MDVVTLANTLTGTKEAFTPLKKGEAKLYSCGPTVYGPQHIGNLRAAVFSDVLARTLSAAGYKVKKVVNITDVGHLVGDGDEGEDKMMVGAKRENVSPKEIASKYAKQYLDDIRALNIDTKKIRFPRATDYIPDQIKMIKALEKNGHTYALPDGVYFDTSTFPDYGKLGKRSGVAIQEGARVEAVAGKRNPQDFVLWRMAKPGDLQKWKSPWGVGNPGWSIECSAMIKALLGPTIDIHTGGEDHVSIHHNNEIAQSEGSSGKPLARYWLHNAFLTVDGQKISKSLGNTYLLSDVATRGFHPLALRYLFLQAHYRSPISFTWEALAASDEALKRLWRISRKIGTKASNASTVFSFNDDLDTPGSLALLWEKLNDASTPESEKRALIAAADAILGLSLVNPPAEPRALSLKEVPEEIRTLAAEREAARDARDFSKADTLRQELQNRGYRVEDTPLGPLFTKTPG